VLWGGFGAQLGSWSCTCTVYHVTLEKNPIHLHLSALHVDGPHNGPKCACHVIDPVRRNTALLHVQHVFKDLLDLANVVSDGFKAA